MAYIRKTFAVLYQSEVDGSSRRFHVLLTLARRTQNKGIGTMQEYCKDPQETSAQWNVLNRKCHLVSEAKKFQVND